MDFRNIDEDSPIISSDIKKTNIYIFTNTDETKWIKMENDNELDEVRDEVRKYMQDEEEALG